MIAKKLWLSFISFLLVAAICFIYIGAISVINVVNTINSPRPTIIIDAGHGGFDGGASNGDVLEKDINLSLALYLKDLLSMLNYDIIMIRTTDKAVNTFGESIRDKKISDMQNRLKVIKNNPNALFISIHLNKYSTSGPSGLQVFYSPNNEKSALLAQNIQLSVKDILQKENHRKIKRATKDTYLLYNAPSPAVIVECGFLSNEKDFNNLTNDIYQRKLCFAIMCGTISTNT